MKRNMDRRTFLKIAGGAVLAGALAGCGGSNAGNGNKPGGGSNPGGGEKPGTDENPGSGENPGSSKKELGYYTAEKPDAQGIYWTYFYWGGSSTTAKLTGYNCSKGQKPRGSIELPSTVDGLSITEVSQYAFAMCGKLDNFQSENYTWSDFSEVTELTIPVSIRKIGYAAFTGALSTSTEPDVKTNLRKVTIRGALELDEAVFAYCNKLEELVGSEKLTLNITRGSIGEFEHAGFRKVTITPNLMYVNNFGSCKQLETVIIADGNTAVSAQILANCNALKKVYIPGSVKKIGISAFYANRTDLPALEVYYGGTKDQWNDVEGRYDRLRSAVMHYSSSPDDVK